MPPIGDDINFALPTDVAELTPAYLTTALRRGGHLANGEVSSVDVGTLILMEDLGDARMADQLAGASLADAQAVIDVGAQLHATWWESPHLDELTWLRPLNNPAYMAVGNQYVQSWPAFAEMFSSDVSARRNRHRLAAQLSIDGCRRHLLLHRPEPDHRNTSRTRRLPRHPKPAGLGRLWLHGTSTG